MTIKTQSFPTTFIKAMIGAWVLTFATVPQSKADYLWVGNSQHWGKVVSINNDAVQFQISCTGDPRSFKWRKGAFAVTFSEGCGPTDFASWGEPVDCRKRGRLFVAGSENGSGYFDLVSYQNEILTLGYKGQKSEVKAPRKEQTGIWLGCE